MGRANFKTSEINAGLLVLYIYINILCLPLTLLLKNGISVWISTLLILIISFYKNRSPNRNFILIATTILGFFLINIIIFDQKNIIIETLIRFIKFSLIPFYLISNRINYNYFFDYLYKLGKIAIIILIIWRIFFNLNYMTVGVALVPAYIGILINYYRKEKNKDLLILILIFSFAVIFVNRGTSLALLGISIYAYILKNKIRNFTIIISLLLFLINYHYFKIIVIKEITGFFISLNRFMIDLNIRSYFLSKMIMMLKKGAIESSSGRDIIYVKSFEIISQNNYFSKGIGYFSYKTGLNYPHNLILELLIDFGFLGIIILLVFLLYSYLKIRKVKSVVKLWQVSLCIYSFFRLMLSSSYWQETLLWVLIGSLIFTKQHLKLKN